MNDIDRFSFFKSYLEGIEKLKNEEDKKEMTWSIVQYVYYNKKPVWSKREREKKELIWTLVEPNLRTSINRANSSKKKKEENQN